MMSPPRASPAPPLELSARAPWTRTTVGFAGSDRVAVVEPRAAAPSTTKTANRHGFSTDLADLLAAIHAITAAVVDAEHHH
jgi:hypothetical protein